MAPARPDPNPAVHAGSACQHGGLPLPSPPLPVFSCSGTFDFFYLPIDFRNKCNLGYCFVNFLDAADAARLYRKFHNKRWEEYNSRKVRGGCALRWALNFASLCLHSACIGPPQLPDCACGSISQLSDPSEPWPLCSAPPAGVRGDVWAGAGARDSGGALQGQQVPL